MRAHLPILPVLLGLTGALLSPIVGLVARPLVWPLAVGTGLAATGAAVAGLVLTIVDGPQRYAVGGWLPPWGIEVVLDPLSAFTATTIASIGTVALLASGPILPADTRHTAPAFYALALLAVTGMLGIVISGDLFNIFVFLEVAAISSYALVASGGGAALAAAFRYLVLGTVGASFYLLGVGLLYALTGTLNMADLSQRLPAHGDSLLFVGGTLFIVVGLAIKMGLFPLHGWLPDAYTHAPAAVSTLLAPIATKAAAYALARTLLYVLRPVELPVGPALAWAGALAIVAGGVMALRQNDARRLLAYSSVSQMGYIVLGLGIPNAQALTGAYLHILNHATMKAMLFMTLGAAALRGRGPTLVTLDLGRGMPVTATCAIIAASSMVGLPPAAGFFSKWYLLTGALEAREPGLIAAVLVGSLLAAVYMYRLTESVWLGGATRRDPAIEAPGVVQVGLIVLAIATLAIGLGNAAIVVHVLIPATGGAR